MAESDNYLDYGIGDSLAGELSIRISPKLVREEIRSANVLSWRSYIFSVFN